jgi:uncharacterized protein related to proFAR isomerase
MHIIPVIDLLGGCAVRAYRGDRSRYQPVVSQLCSGSAPLDVASAMLAYCSADTLYLADLDAITGHPVQTDVIRTLLDGLPASTQIWLDAGFANADVALNFCRQLGKASSRLTPVFGSESLSQTSPFIQFPQALLSLDQRSGKPMGDDYWWHHAQHWPRDIIAMTLDQVGSFEGPNLAMLDRLQRLGGPSRRLVGAGGIRDDTDLHAAAATGAHAWLVASALHDRRIAPRIATSQISSLQSRNA